MNDSSRASDSFRSLLARHEKLEQTRAAKERHLDTASVAAHLDDSRLASWMYERIVSLIDEFEASIPDNMQAGGRFVSSAAGYTFSIDDVDSWNPDLIMFYGTGPDGAKVQLLQHTSQLNLLLVAVPRTDDLSKPRRKIGFHPKQEEPLPH